MAQDNDPGKLPPKIKLNGSSHPTPVPKSPKSETARIDLSGARIPSDEEFRKQTAQIAPAPGMTELSEEDRAEATKKSTVRIDAVANMEPYTEEDRGEATKKSTVKIDSALAMTPLPEEERGEATKKSTVKIDPATGMAPFTQEEREEILKRATIRIDTVAGIQPLPEEDKIEAAKKSTVRVQIDEDRAKGDTARLDTAAIAGQDQAKKRTTRINLNEVLEDDQDIFKRRTALLDASKFAATTEAPGMPRTIRIKRPDTPPTTSLRAQPADGAGPTPIAAAEIETSKKSETARIDLPPEMDADQPPTRRKTIRIKRPSGGPVTSKPLIITRAAETGEISGSKGAASEAEDSPVFSGVALAAVLVTAILIYVLAAQTIAPNMPFPGRL